ncbi:hypothetical protein BY996DRAFT_6452786 [Phakopsora pachyrhizi]|nr:hypothetical protein BY996DRAFT_6452786 [Phakopsora pachyrhizi]
MNSPEDEPRSPTHPVVDLTGPRAECCHLSRPIKQKCKDLIRLGQAGHVGQAWKAGAWFVSAVLGPRLGPGAGREGRAGKGSAGLGWVLGLIGQAGQAGSWLGWAGDEIRTKLRPVIKPERQAEGFWVKAIGVKNLQLFRDVDHVAVVEKASFESGCDFDTKVIQGVMWH